MISICKRIGHFPQICTSEKEFRRLEKATLPGCPFDNYHALDLLRDLFLMYDCIIEPGHTYTLDEFLTLCNDIKAEAYRKILTGR